MDRDQILTQIMSAIVEGEEELAEKYVQEAIDHQLEPLDILHNGLTKGIEIVGQKFADGYYFLPDMLLGAQAMEKGIKILEPLLVEQDRETAGKVIMGTVQGDLHEIGKNIVIMMLKAAGFEVIDLGVDVPADRFIEAVKDNKPDVVGISALLTTTVARQQEIIELLEEEGLRKKVKVIVGGAPINQNWADEIGADGYAEEATGAVDLVKKLVKS